MQFNDKTSFMNNYRTQHPEMWVYLALSLAFDIIGTVIIAINGIELAGSHYRSDESKLIALVFLGLFFWILGSVFLFLLKKAEANGNKEYELYLKTNAPHDGNNPANHNASSLFVICKKCGTENGKSNNNCYKCGAPLLISPPNQTTPNTRASFYNGTWTCPKCGKVHQNYVGTCGCGEQKPI